MAEKNRNELKSFFETGDKPTESQFADLIDSAYNLAEDDSAWQEPSLMNGFSNYGFGWQTVRFRKKNGVVFLEGVIQGGSTHVPIFILPPDFCPSENLIFSTIGNSGYARVNVKHDGEVESIISQSQWISLNGISFIVD